MKWPWLVWDQCGKVLHAKICQDRIGQIGTLLELVLVVLDPLPEDYASIKAEGNGKLGYIAIKIRDEFGESESSLIWGGIRERWGWCLMFLRVYPLSLPESQQPHTCNRDIILA